jgi:putative transposase
MARNFMHVFRKLTEVREQAELWLADYTREIPHDSLGGLTPAQFRQQNDPATVGYVWSKFTGGATAGPSAMVMGQGIDANGHAPTRSSMAAKLQHWTL